MKTFVTAVIGCGAISDIYLTNLTTRFSGIRVKYCCAAHFENAQKKAKQYINDEHKTGKNHAHSKIEIGGDSAVIISHSYLLSKKIIYYYNR